MTTACKTWLAWLEADVTSTPSWSVPFGVVHSNIGPITIISSIIGYEVRAG